MEKLVKKLFSFFLIIVFSPFLVAQEDEGLVLGERDPFRPPAYIEDTQKPPVNDKITDESIEAIRRWPLQVYKPIAVIWDVSDPKVMVLDANNVMHLLKKNYRIGNQNGIVTEINEGEIVVNENNVPHVIKIDKGTTK